MIRVRTAWAVLVLCAWSAPASIAAPLSSSPGDTASRQEDGRRILDVPYLPQSEDLCGGAALAMVMRYWGERQVFAEDFAPLVDRSRAGILTTTLVDAVSRRGWTPVPFVGDAATGSAWIEGQIAQGRPVIALIAVGEQRFHYVVVVASTATQVVVHDPAAAPFQVMPHAAFARAWAPADHWAVAILPPLRSGVPSSSPSPSSTPADAGPCGALREAMVARAQAGDLAGAESGLTAATSLCADSAAAWRELAGLRFLQKRWAEAGAHAARAAALDPGDASAWDLLATSRFLDGQPDAALAAWNRIGRPVLDLVRVEGPARTRQPVIAALVRLPSRGLLTTETVARAARRLDELPSAALTRLRYRPLADGLAQVDAVVMERPRLPHGAVPLAAWLARTAVHRELRLDVASPTGSGELWSAAWRFWDARPRVAVALALPSRGGLPGVTTIEGAWERQSYAAPLTTAGGAPTRILQPERLRVAAGLADWATSRLRWSASAAIDRWDGARHVSLAGGLDQRLAADRVALGVAAAAWTPVASTRRFARAGVSLAARSSSGPSGATWDLQAGLTQATARAPLDLWPGAGTGYGRDPLLRAHPLLDDGVVSGAAFGRRLAHATLEMAPVVRARPAATLRLAAFIDGARAWSRLRPDDTEAWHVDAGTGLRLSLPGRTGRVRLDLARGLRDGRMAVSAAWDPAWPRR